MSNRVTQKDLEQLVAKLNEKQGIENSKWNALGVYQLDYAYGGVKLVKIVSSGGGQTNISSGGYGTKRELYTFLRGMTYSN